MGMSVGEVIERLRAQGNAASSGGLKFRDPEPVPPELLKTLTLAMGKKAPADLLEWLRYDGKMLKFFKKDGTTPRWRPLRKVLVAWLKKMRESDDEDIAEQLEELVDLVEDEDDVLGFWLGALPEASLAEVRALQIPSAGDQEHLLMFEPGRTSLRVLGCHKRIEFWWKYDSLASYLAHQLGFEDEPS